MTKTTNNFSILALDIGDKRIGLARAGSIAKLPEPLETIQNNSNFVKNLQKVIERENVQKIVAGIPRNLSGQETQQSQKIRDFVQGLETSIGTSIEFVDESLSSKRADFYLNSNKNLVAEQDSVAACYILEEYFSTSKEQS